MQANTARTTQVKVCGHLQLMGFPKGQRRTALSRGPLEEKCQLSCGLSPYSTEKHTVTHSLTQSHTHTHTHTHIGSCLERHSRPRSQLLSPASGGIASIWPVTLARATVAFLICQRAGAILWLSWLICSRRQEETHTHTHTYTHIHSHTLFPLIWLI